MILSLEEKLQKREAGGNLRGLQLRKNLIDFSSNDYLGIGRSPKFAAGILEECGRRVESCLFGSTGSRLLTGNTLYAEELEKSIALFHGYETGLIFNCGYMANIGLLSTVAGDRDIIFYDSEVHASIREGIRLSTSKAFPFRHNDIEHLENRLKKNSCRGNQFISVESIYSTDGSVSPLPEICRLAKKYGARVLVDEAHAVGVSGILGKGLVDEYNLSSEVFAQVNTFGKALGAHGAIVLGGPLLKKSLINFANSYIYTTALPLHSLIAIQSGYHLFPRLENERIQLKKNISIFRNLFPNSSSTHIQAIRIKGNEKVKKASQKLLYAGFDIRPLTSPTVRRGHEILRISLHAFNTESELIRLFQEIGSIKEMNFE